MTRRQFSREFKIEAVKLVTERGVSVSQACRAPERAESVLRRRMGEAAWAPATAFPGNGQQRAELAEIAALKKEVTKLKAKRDIKKLRRIRKGPLHGWLPREKGDDDLRQLVGCGHVFGVSIAVEPRALMNVRVRLGSLSMARALGAMVRTGCPGLMSVSLPSSHFALAISIGPRAAHNSCPCAARLASPVLR